ncbi:MAG TPA: hypothetical protein VGC18_04590 [Lacisediminihabitans sp.]|uniref:hypothetical protein n=1 Tax=Lacisediminihabitans sp. TaxID=2787631 RepID=UPI002ED78F17
MLSALLLLLIGSADIVRQRRAAVTAGIGIAIIWMAVTFIGWFGCGVPLWATIIPVVMAAGWLATTTSREHVRRPAGLWPVAGLAGSLVLLLAFDHTGISTSGFVVDWHADAPIGLLRATQLPTLALALATFVFLTESSNVIVRAALHPRVEPVQAPGFQADDIGRPRMRMRWRQRTVGSEKARPVATSTTDLSSADLRGGRLIGPLERLLIVALTLSGAYAIVAAIIAAKGIVRFPEISRDGLSGSKAEYFLVGSLVSWTVAVVAAGLLWLSVQGF